MLLALQFAGAIVAAVPLNVTVLVPCVAPKFAPAIVTAVPTGPDAGVRLAKAAEPSNVIFFPRRARP